MHLSITMSASVRFGFLQRAFDTLTCTSSVIERQSRSISVTRVFLIGQPEKIHHAIANVQRLSS